MNLTDAQLTKVLHTIIDSLDRAGGMSFGKDAMVRAIYDGIDELRNIEAERAESFEDAFKKTGYIWSESNIEKARVGWDLALQFAIPTIQDELAKTHKMFSELSQKYIEVVKENDKLLKALKRSVEHLITADALAVESFHLEIEEINSVIKEFSS